MKNMLAILDSQKEVEQNTKSYKRTQHNATDRNTAVAGSTLKFFAENYPKIMQK